MIKPSCCAIHILNTKSQLPEWDGKTKSFPSCKAGFIIFHPVMKKILLVQSYGTLWGFPKGHSNQGETPFECALRELKEETGIELPENVDKTTLHLFHNVTYFLCKENVKYSASEIHDTNEISGIAWVCPQCIQQLNITSHVKKFLNKYSKELV